MASSNSNPAADAGVQDKNPLSSSTAPSRPTQGLTNARSTQASVTIAEGATSKKRRNHRGGKRKKSRRQSFAVPNEEDETANPARSNQDLTEPQTASSARYPIYKLGQSGGRTVSSSSLDSQELLDHRCVNAFVSTYIRRTKQVAGTTLQCVPVVIAGLVEIFTQIIERASRTMISTLHIVPPTIKGLRPPPITTDGNDQAAHMHHPAARAKQRTWPLQIAHLCYHHRITTRITLGMGLGTDSSMARQVDMDANSKIAGLRQPLRPPARNEGDCLVDNSLHPPMAMMSTILRLYLAVPGWALTWDGDLAGQFLGSSSSSPRKEAVDHRRHTIATGPEDDVCYPLEGMSEMAEDDFLSRDQSNADQGTRRRRYRKWPDLTVLDEWSREEKEERSEGIRAKKISEPVLIGGRLRPQKYGWHRTEEDAPYRFTYFNEELPSTIHSQTISELLQPGQSFEELFVPEPPELSSDESSDDEDLTSRQGTSDRQALSPSNHSKAGTRHPSLNGDPREVKTQSSDRSGEAMPQQPGGTGAREKPKRYGARPTFWLDVLSPTEIEMRVISKTFGIHPLTAEDIMMQEAREKVELFRHYYFVNYRTFEQDTSSENYLEPVNMYVVVFREGVISFHFSMTPHPANVRRRIRQLKDYLILSSDWISYAIIDDITDVFAPLIQSIEEEVDDIDDQILQLHSPSKPEQDSEKSKNNEKASVSGEPTLGESGGDMLRRVGEGRKKVMGLYRLLGNKADVIKGFAKRCNEYWEIAPRSEIGLYLGDIQDHILTMTSNLSHYETLLSRAHSNYLAQINIRMNERQEQTADVLGKLTVLGTIVLPMNIITGMWGMNVLVPGQNVGNLNWFWSISGGLLLFGISCFFIAKRVYGIV
ncbi:MAG: hypothetical protein Q9181_003780 [Wetmoreana brouardii]